MKLDKTNLGSEGLQVTRIGLGCMGMSEFYGASDEKSNLSLLDHAAGIGCDFWDTADMYGPFTNEELLAKALKGRRDQITLATKFGNERKKDGTFIRVNGHPDYVKSSCDASLKRLGTDYIDLYYQHRVDTSVPIEETVGAMADLVQAGKVKYLGLSEASVDQIERAHKIHPISALQTEYSLWSRDVEEILPTTRKLGIGFVAYSPLGRGFLTGKIEDRSKLDEGDWRLKNPRFQENAIEQNRKLVARVVNLANQKGITAAQLALAWVLAQGNDISMIPGTRQVNYLEQNRNARDVTLSTDDLSHLNDLRNHDVIGARY